MKQSLCMWTALFLSAGSAWAQPANDSCDTPFTIPPEGAVVDVIYAGATADPQVPSCVPQSPPIVWYRYTAPQEGRLNVTTCGGTNYNYFSIWSDCGTERWCSAFGGACADGEAALYGLPVAAGESLLIGVATFDFFSGQTRLNVTPHLGPPPANDECAGAIEITNGDTPISNGTATDGSPASCGVPGRNAAGDVWYRYTPTCTEFASVGISASTFGAASLEVFDGCNGTPIGCNSGTNGENRVIWAPSPGQEYLIRVAGYTENYQYPSYGTAVLSAGCFSAAPNDTCETAQAVTLGFTDFDTRYAHTDWAAPACVEQDTNDVFFSFTPKADTYVFAATSYGNPTNSGIHTSLSVYDSCDPNSIINCDDLDLNDLPSFQWHAQAGHTYILRAASQPGNVGTGGLILNSVAFPAPNDECAGALAVQAGTTEFDTRRFTAGAYTSADPLHCFGSSFPGGESLFNNDLWFVYTSTDSDVLSVIVTDQNFVAEIYDGCNGNLVACTDQYVLLATGHDGRGTCFDAVADGTYIIRIGQDFFSGGAQGRLIIEHLGHQVFSIPDNAIAELEDCANGVDINAGCLFGTPKPDVQPLDLCQPVLGTVFVDNDGLLDADFYEVQLQEGVSYILEGQSEAPIFIAVGGQETCNHELEELTLARLDGTCRIDFSLPFVPDLAPTRYFVWVYSENGKINCGGVNRYWFSVSPVTGCCVADFNGSGELNSQDFFDFLVAFFAGDARADFNADSIVNSQDFFDYLVVFFNGCD